MAYDLKDSKKNEVKVKLFRGMNFGLPTLL